MKFDRLCGNSNGSAIIRKVGNNDRTRANYYISSDGNILNHAGTNANLRTASYFHAAANGGIGGKMYEVAQHAVMFHDCASIDDTMVSHFCTGINNRAGENLRSDP